MSVIFWSIVSSLLWATIAFGIAHRKQNALHIGVFFSLLFIINYPLKLLSTEFGIAVIDSSLYGVDWQLYALFLSNVSALLFVLPLVVLTTRPRGPNSLADPEPGGIRWTWLVLFLALVCFSYGMDPIMRLVSRSELRELISLRGEQRVGSALSALSRQTAQIALIFFCLSLARNLHLLSRFTRVSIFLFAILVSYALLGMSGSKNIALQPFAFFVLSYNWIRCMRGRSWPLRTVLALGVTGVVALTLTAYVRGFATADTEYPEGRAVHAVQQLMAAFDAPDNLTQILYQMEDITWGDLNYAPTLDNLFRSMVPRAIWSDKPLLMGNQRIMAEYFPDRFTDYTGEVLVPSMPGEMVVSGGVVFLIPASLILGALFALVYQLAHRPDSTRLTFVLYIWLTLNVFNLLRSGTGIMGPFLVFVGLSILIVWISSFLAPVRRQEFQSVTPE